MCRSLVVGTNLDIKIQQKIIVEDRYDVVHGEAKVPENCRIFERNGEEEKQGRLTAAELMDQN